MKVDYPNLLLQPDIPIQSLTEEQKRLELTEIQHSRLLQQQKVARKARIQEFTSTSWVQPIVNSVSPIPVPTEQSVSTYTANSHYYACNKDLLFLSPPSATLQPAALPAPPAPAPAPPT